MVDAVHRMASATQCNLLSEENEHKCAPSCQLLAPWHVLQTIWMDRIEKAGIQVIRAIQESRSDTIRRSATAHNNDFCLDRLIRSRVTYVVCIHCTIWWCMPIAYVRSYVRRQNGKNPQQWAHRGNVCPNRSLWRSEPNMGRDLSNFVYRASYKSIANACKDIRSARSRLVVVVVIII